MKVCVLCVGCTQMIMDFICTRLGSVFFFFFFSLSLFCYLLIQTFSLHSNFLIILLLLQVTGFYLLNGHYYDISINTVFIACGFYLCNLYVFWDGFSKRQLKLFMLFVYSYLIWSIYFVFLSWANDLNFS